MKLIFTSLLPLIVVALMSKQAPAQVGQLNENLSVSVQDLRTAPTEVVLDGRSLTLWAYPWRDFMPGLWQRPDGSPLMVVFKIATSDKKPLPGGVRPDGAWVLFGEQAWEISNLRRNVAQVPDNQNLSGTWIACPVSPLCEFTIRDGPRWGPRVLVDAVVRFADKDGQHYLLRAPKQTVVATF